MKKPNKINERVTTAGLMAALFTCAPLFAQSEGPATPAVDGTSPLIGYLIAVVLSVLLVVVSIIPSKRHVEDI